MSLSGTGRLPIQGGSYQSDFRSSSFNRHSNNNINSSYDSRRKFHDPRYSTSTVDTGMEPSIKRRKSSSYAWVDDRGMHYRQQNTITNAPSTSCSLYPVPTRPEVNACKFPSSKHEQTKLEDDVVFMSRDEIERCSPSRKDGIDVLRETHLRYSYCTFLQNVGMRLQL